MEACRLQPARPSNFQLPFALQQSFGRRCATTVSAPGPSPLTVWWCSGCRSRQVARLPATRRTRRTVVRVTFIRLLTQRSAVSRSRTIFRVVSLPGRHMTRSFCRRNRIMASIHCTASRMLSISRVASAASCSLSCRRVPLLTKSLGQCHQAAQAFEHPTPVSVNCGRTKPPIRRGVVRSRTRCRRQDRAPSAPRSRFGAPPYR